MKTIITLLAFALTVSACGKDDTAKQCNTFCEIGVGCTIDEGPARNAAVSECKSNCETQLEDANITCNKAFESFVNCSEGRDCSEYSNPETMPCQTQAAAFYGACEQYFN